MDNNGDHLPTDDAFKAVLTLLGTIVDAKACAGRSRDLRSACVALQEERQALAAERAEHAAECTRREAELKAREENVAEAEYRIFEAKRRLQADLEQVSAWKDSHLRRQVGHAGLVQEFSDEETQAVIQELG